MNASVVPYTLLCWGGFVGLVSLTSSPYSSKLFVLLFLARNLSKPEDGRYRPKHVVFCP